ncbi:hypothetical protein HWV62_12090 [Athelia sp. TMB]|nr:hypothetical protein HWV62_12090 [Athelia sp. TMB]
MDFPAMMSSATTLSIIEEVAKFKFNREEWAGFALFLRNGVTAIVQSLGTKNVLEKRDVRVRRTMGNLARELSRVKAQAFTTRNTFGGTVVNVAGDYNTYTLDNDERVAGIKYIPALDKLSYAEGASWNPSLVCLAGTRATTLSLINDWSRSMDKCNVLLLKGVAGSGKSAISHTVAQALHECGLLASSFFFNREFCSRNNPRLLFATIARDIASLYPAIAADISASLEKEPALASAHISRQFEAFISGPLRRHPIDRPVVLVIDALDEAVPDDGNTDLLTILRDGIAELSPYFRIVITSRPTRLVDQFLSGKQHITSHILDIDSSENRQDIASYIDIMLRDNAMNSQMGTPWPDEALIHDLKIMADGLFLWIATVLAYLRSAYKPAAKLRALLSKSHPQSPLEPTKNIDNLYAAILEACGDWEDVDFVADYVLFMGAVMALKRPLSLAALRALNGADQDLSLDYLPQRFGSVLVGLHDDHTPIHTLHISFREFVTIRAANSVETRKFFLSEQEHSQKLAELCIRTMVRELAAGPITGTGYLKSGQRGIPKLTGVSEQLLYSCEHWGDHICHIEGPASTLQQIIREFMPRHHTTSIEIVAAASSFVGSLSIWRWFREHGAEFKELYNAPSQAERLLILSNKLAYEGRPDESLSAIVESVELRRELVGQQPIALCAPFEADLALSLTHLSLRLSDLGHRERALMTIREAKSFYRTLAADQPAAFNAGLAVSLNILSIRLTALGQREEALIAIEEAVNLRRALAVERPEAYNAELARSLNNLSKCLSALGRREEALTVIQEAAILYRTLTREWPARFGADHAWSLNQLSNCLSHFGRRQESLAAIQEAVVLRRALAAERPAKFNAELAWSLNALSDCLSAIGRREEALLAIQEAVALRRVLVAERPAKFNAELAWSLSTLSSRLSDSDRHEESLEIIQEAVALRRSLAAERPAKINSELAWSLKRLCICLSHLGRHDEAVVAIQETANLYRVLAAERPAIYAFKFADSLQMLSNCLLVTRRVEEALIISREAWSYSYR